MSTAAEPDVILPHTYAEEFEGEEHPPNRLSTAPRNRILLAAIAAGMVGAGLGVTHGANMTALRFRAENAHRLPRSQQGWFLYHKSKNYAVMLGGIKEARRMGTKLAIWTTLFLGIEELLDRSRRRRDALSSVCAGLTTAGAFSLYSKQLSVTKLKWRTQL